MNHALTPDQTFPIHYRNTSIAKDSELSDSTIRNAINLGEIPSSASVLEKLPEKADETHVVYTKIQKMARLRNMPFGFFNMTIWKPQSDPQVPLIALPREKWDSNQFSITTGPGPSWVDLVVNNLDEGPHPFHMVSIVSNKFLSFIGILIFNPGFPFIICCIIRYISLTSTARPSLLHPRHSRIILWMGLI